MNALIAFLNFSIFMILMFGIVTFLATIITLVDKSYSDDQQKTEDNK